MLAFIIAEQITRKMRNAIVYSSVMINQQSLITKSETCLVVYVPK